MLAELRARRQSGETLEIDDARLLATLAEDIECDEMLEEYHMMQKGCSGSAR
jgi:hypothetical protein